jgi:hypothetical protein
MVCGPVVVGIACPAGLASVACCWRPGGTAL